LLKIKLILWEVNTLKLNITSILLMILLTILSIIFTFFQEYNKWDINRAVIYWRNKSERTTRLFSNSQQTLLKDPKSRLYLYLKFSHVKCITFHVAIFLHCDLRIIMHFCEHGYMDYYFDSFMHNYISKF